MTWLASVLLRGISRLPMGVLYAISDFMYLLAYRVFGVGRRLTEKNLRNSFPEKDAAEIRQLGRAATRSTVNVAAEIVKAMTMPRDEIRRRVIFRNVEVANQLLENGESIMLLASHQCNWEWVLYAGCTYMNSQFDALYEPLHYQFMDRLFLDMRTRMGARMVSAMGNIKELIKTDKPVRTIGIVGDQGPGRWERKYWTRFLNQETAFFASIQTIARVTKCHIFFTKMTIIRRGYYNVDLEKIAAPPHGKGYDVIEKYARSLEAHIRANPAEWLWAYRRWKYDRSIDNVRHRHHRIRATDGN